MPQITVHKPGRRSPLSRGPLRHGNPLVVYAVVALGSMLLLGGVAVAAVV